MLSPPRGAVHPAAGLPPVIVGSAGERLWNHDGGCQHVCFEEAYWPSAVQREVFSSAHADEVRLAAWRSCGMDPPLHVPAALDGGAGRVARVMYLPRGNGRREVLNYGQLLRWAAEAGMEPQPTPANMTTFCGQVALMSQVDILLSGHGAALTNIMFMRPHTVVIEFTSHGFYLPDFKVLAAHARVNYLEYRNPFPDNEDAPGRPRDTNFCLEKADVTPFLALARALVGATGWHRQPCMTLGPIGVAPAQTGNNEHVMPPLHCTPPGYTLPGPWALPSESQPQATDTATDMACDLPALRLALGITN
jgi:hypothetical protein